MAHAKQPIGEGLKHAIVEVTFHLDTSYPEYVVGVEARMRLAWHEAGRRRETRYTTRHVSQLPFRVTTQHVQLWAEFVLYTWAAPRPQSTMQFFGAGRVWTLADAAQAYAEIYPRRKEIMGQERFTEAELAAKFPHVSWAISKDLAKLLKPDLADGELTIEV